MRRGEIHDALARGRRFNILLPVLAVLIGVGLLVNYTVGSSPKSTVAPAFTAAELAAAPTDNWSTSGGSLSNQRYSPLSQVSTANVAAYATTNDRKVGPRVRCDATPGPCAHNDQGVDRREERRDARV